MSEPHTLLDILDAAEGSRTAIVLPDVGFSVTYDDLRRRVGSMAAALRAAGFDNPSRRCTSARDNPEFWKFRWAHFFPGSDKGT